MPCADNRGRANDRDAHSRILEDAGATSFDFAATQNEAIAAASHRAPAMITSDVKLLEGTGPLAVETIHRQVDPTPVLFISATPQDCEPCPEQARVISKPFAHGTVVEAFRQLSGLAPYTDQFVVA